MDITIIRAVNTLKNIEEAVRADTLKKIPDALPNEFGAFVHQRVALAVQIYAAELIANAVDNTVNHD